MSIGRAQMEEQIKGFRGGGLSSLSSSGPSEFDVDPATRAAYDEIMKDYVPPTSPLAPADPFTEYEQRVRSIYSQRQPIGTDDISQRVQELSTIFGRPQRQDNLYDLAGALSRGLIQQAQSGRPSSIGYGLAMGFDIFNEARNKRRDMAQKLKQELSMMAYDQLEKERKEKMTVEQQLAEANLELLLKQMAQGNQFFPGKTERAAALNYILQAEKDPSLKETDEYRVARALIEQPRRSYQQTEQGLIEIEQPGLNIDRIFNRGSGATMPTVPAIEGYTFTFQYKDGKPVYRNNVTGKLAVNE